MGQGWRTTRRGGRVESVCGGGGDGRSRGGGGVRAPQSEGAAHERVSVLRRARGSAVSEMFATVSCKVLYKSGGDIHV
eukprot:5592202-Pleurochrysis_carterae.AAC.1